MHWQIEHFIGAAERLERPEQTFALLAESLANLGFPKVAYVDYSPDKESGRDFTYWTTYPGAWVIRYLEQDYIKHDPVILRSVREISPFCWGTERHTKRLTKKQRRIFEEAGDFEIRGGATIPIHGFGNKLAALSVSSPMADSEFEKTWSVHGHAVHLIALYLHTALPKRGPSNDAIDTDVSLNGMERDCLSWVAQGKTVDEMADHLTLPREAVLTHLRAARTKLNASTDAQAAVKAVAIGLICP